MCDRCIRQARDLYALLGMPWPKDPGRAMTVDGFTKSKIRRERRKLAAEQLRRDIAPTEGGKA